MGVVLDGLMELNLKMILDKKSKSFLVIKYIFYYNILIIIIIII
jgi:hypothetical protein